jgi:integrase
LKGSDSATGPLSTSSVAVILNLPSVRVKLAPQRLKKRLVRTHEEPVLRVILAYRPKTFPHWRIHALVSTILDTGCRIEELLTARTAGFDFDNLLLIVYGKARKERRVPFSIELRRLLFRFGQMKGRMGIRSDLMFPAREGEHLEALLLRAGEVAHLLALGRSKVYELNADLRAAHSADRHGCAGAEERA